MWLLPVWTRQGQKQEQPQCANGTIKAMSGGMADTTLASYRNTDKKPSLAHSARTLARSCGNSASTRFPMRATCGRSPRRLTLVVLRTAYKNLLPPALARSATPRHTVGVSHLFQEALPALRRGRGCRRDGHMDHSQGPGVPYNTGSCPGRTLAPAGLPQTVIFPVVLLPRRNM
jgi:hypothetical protein